MKKKTQKAKDAKTPECTPARERTSIAVAAHQLRPAPWNPRPEITSESVADITASLPKVGLIHPLAVMKDPDKPSVKGVDFYVIISGHRRYKACVDAGYHPIPCDVMDVDVDTAKRITIIENLQRKDADPILESELVKNLIDRGMTQAEIAAETGRTERWVARRANLMNLSDSWRKRVKKGEKFTTDCLEHIAAYPVEIQEKLKDTNTYGKYDDAPMGWDDFRCLFDNESRNLGSAAFNTAQCLGCASNTGCSPDLFDLDGGKNAKLGRCLCDKCWREKSAAHVAETVAKAEKKGVEVVKGKPDYGCWNLSDRKTKTHTTLYVYTEYGGEKVVKWAPAPKKPVAEDKEAKKAERAKKRARKLAQQALSKWLESDEAKSAIDGLVGLASHTLPDGKYDNVVTLQTFAIGLSLGITDYDASISAGELATEMLATGDFRLTPEQYEQWRGYLVNICQDGAMSNLDSDIESIVRIFGRAAAENLPPGTLDAIMPADTKNGNAEQQD